MYLLFISLLFTFYSSVLFATGNSWTIDKLPIALSKTPLPNVFNSSKSSVIYLKRHPAKRNTRFYILTNDVRCKKDSLIIEVHFVYINDEKDLFMSSCWGSSYRRFYSLSDEVVLLGQFWSKDTVEIKEVDPKSDSSPINLTFNTKNFKHNFHTYNKQTGY